MAENTASTRKHALCNEEMESRSSVAYPRCPIPRSPRIPKTTLSHDTHYPCTSSNQSGSWNKMRHKSPANRHISPHRTQSKNKATHDWDETNAVRKTQSTALPSLINAPWPKSTTVSTPTDLMVEDESVGSAPPTRNGRTNRLRGHATCYHNFRLIFIILNCAILMAGLIYFLAASFLAAYRETAFVIVEYRIFAISIIILYTDAIILLVLSVVALCAINCETSRKIHVGCSIMAVAFTISLGILQTTLQTNIQIDAGRTMIASIARQTGSHVATTKVVWDNIHETFGCCGTHGHLDWCEKNDGDGDPNNSSNFLGTYTCNLPVSCCIDDIAEITSLKRFNGMNESYITPCAIFPTLWNTYRSGCVSHVKREIRFVGKLFKIASFGTAIIMLLSSATATILVFYE